MRRGVHYPALFLVLLGVLVVLWVRFGLGTDAEPGPVLGLTHETAAGEPDSKDAELVASHASLDSVAKEEPRREALAPGPKEFEPPADALWINGRVLFPVGTPADEVLRIEARGIGFAKAPTVKGRFEVEVGTDGRFRVAFSRDSKRGSLALKGRYLYTEIAIRVNPQEQGQEELRIEAILGGAVAVRIRPVEGLRPKTEEIEKIQARLIGSPPGTASIQRDSKVDADGLFLLRAVPAGNDYRVSMESDNFVCSQFEGVVVHAGEVTELQAIFSPGVRLAGRIVGSDGVGLRGVSITVASEDSGADPLQYDFGSMRTDAEGRFAVGGLRPGLFTITVDARGYEERIEELGQLGAGAVRDGLHYQLRKGGSLKGVVYWPDGTTVSNVRVRVRQLNERGNRVRSGRDLSARSQSDGSFHVEGIDSELVVLNVSARRRPEKRAALVPGESTADRRVRIGGLRWTCQMESLRVGTEGLRLTLEPPSTLVGRVLNAQVEPVHKFKVEARPGKNKPGVLRFQETIRRSFSGQRGEFKLTELKPGIWIVSVKAEGYTESESEPVVVPNSGELLLTLHSAAIVRGVVRTPLGKPVPRARVSVQRINGSTTHSSTVSANIEGRYEVSGLKAGTLKLMAAAKDWGNSAYVSLEVDAGETREGVDFTLIFPATLTGEVHPDSGPIANRQVQVWAQNHHQSAKTDMDGHFTFEGLPAGELKVALYSAEVEFEQLGNSRFLIPTNSITIEMQEGETRHVVLHRISQEPAQEAAAIQDGE